MSDVSFDFSGKTALVIGGTTGIGRATALEFAMAGANVVVAGLGAEDGLAVEADIHRMRKGAALFVETDVRDESDIANLMTRAVELFGRIHFAVNNAGTEGRFGPIQDQPTEEFDRVLGVNVRGVFLGLKYEIRHMLAHGGGAIVNTASNSGLVGIANLALYTASKHAIVGLTKAVALELGRSNIRVNAVAPGAVETGFLHRTLAGKVDVRVIAQANPMGRIATPEEIAATILWLCSDAAPYITGHTLAIDGGSTVA